MGWWCLIYFEGKEGRPGREREGGGGGGGGVWVFYVHRRKRGRSLCVLHLFGRVEVNRKFCMYVLNLLVLLTADTAHNQLLGHHGCSDTPHNQLL